MSSSTWTKFNKKKLESEVKYISNEQRQTFERPYGLAWLLQLVMELDEWAQEEKEVWFYVKLFLQIFFLFIEL